VLTGHLAGVFTGARVGRLLADADRGIQVGQSSGELKLPPWRYLEHSQRFRSRWVIGREGIYRLLQPPDTRIQRAEVAAPYGMVQLAAGE
jgi:hypothetical protein